MANLDSMVGGGLGAKQISCLALPGAGEQDCPDEPGPVPQVIVLVKLCQVEHILGDQFGLDWVCQIHLHNKVDHLQLDLHQLGTGYLGDLPHDI